MKIEAIEAERELARREMGRREAQRSTEAFCLHMDERYEQTTHTKKLCETLDALAEGDIDKLAIFMPPRCGKTYHAGERFPAYFLGRNPEAQIITTSYTLDLARHSSRRARALVEERELWPWREVDLADDSTAVDNWHTNHGGAVKAAGVGGSITGFGAHLLIIDDPIKGRQEADSETVRDATWQWYTEVARTRLMRGGRQLLMTTRWHEGDPAGRILNSPGANEWTVLSLPWFALANDPLGRAEGEPLWAGGPPVPSVEKGEISSRGFQALYQQNPEPDGGLVFRREWLSRTYVNAPTPSRTVLAVDGAWKTGVGADRSAMALWGTDKTSFWPIDVLAGRWEYPQLREHLIAFSERHNPGKVLIEDAASGTALIQELKQNTRLPVIAVKPIVSKIARVEAITPLFESGRVQIPERAEWKDEWVGEHLRFPAGAHDDMVDTTSMALSDLGKPPRFMEAIAV